MASDLLGPKPQAQCLLPLPLSRGPCWPESPKEGWPRGRRDSVKLCEEALKNGAYRLRPLAREGALGLSSPWGWHSGFPSLHTSFLKPGSLPGTRIQLWILTAPTAPTCSHPLALASASSSHSFQAGKLRPATRSQGPKTMLRLSLTKLGLEDDEITRRQRGATADINYN